MNTHKISPIAIGVIVLIIILSIGGIWYWQSRNTVPQTSQTNPTLPGKVSSTTAPTLGAELYQKTQNPVGSKLPETNPFKNTDTNPLKQAVPNPF